MCSGYGVSYYIYIYISRHAFNAIRCSTKTEATYKVDDEEYEQAKRRYLNMLNSSKPSTNSFNTNYAIM